MVEERNENLQPADGMNEQTEASKNTVENTNPETEKKVTEEVVQTQDNLEETVETKVEENIEETTHQLAEEKTVEEVVDEIEKDLATASEAADEVEQTAVPKQDIPFLPYKEMDFKTLLDEAKRLFEEHPVQKIKKHLDEIRAAFDDKVHQVIVAAKEQNPEEEVTVDIPERREFNAFWKDYREKYNNYRKEIQEKLEANLKIKQDLIEELKSIIESTELDFNERLKAFKDIQKRWRTSGNVPRAMYSDIWQTFKHHEERFYDLLDLDRDYRDKIFKENLEVKQNIINKAKELLTQNDIHHIFKELQNLHLQWKEETGPVAREQREAVWEEFKEVTKKIHDKRREFYKKLKEEFVGNLAKKQEIIEKLKEATAEIPETHKQWQSKIKEVEKLRESFYQIGYIPKKNRDEIWTAFKDSVKDFNKYKNNFYKSLKELQKENLDKKLNLIKIAEEWKDSEDWKEATNKFKQIQEEWKTVGHVPRKYSEKLWKEFRETCNYYFDRFHKQMRSEKSVEMENFLKKKEYLQKVKEQFKEIDENIKYTIEDIKKIIEEWKTLGYVPENKHYVNVKFNKFIDSLYDKLKVDKRELSFERFKNTVDAYLEQGNYRKIDSEKRYVRQKVEAILKEIQQLENNMMFIKSANENNPFKREVENNVARNLEILEFWKKKQQYLDSLNY